MTLEREAAIALCRERVDAPTTLRHLISVEGVMRSLGGIGLSATTEAEYAAALAEACAAKGPVLIDVAVDPSGYPAQIKALRG